jgi:hypothetical protein
MNSESLKQEIRQAAVSYAQKRDLPIDDSHASAVLFPNLGDNFHPKSFASIMGHPDWQQRTTKRHQNVPGALEMQSSNSSDALLMNIFCHPDICRWKGVEKLLEEELGSISFGFPGQVHINGGQPDSTEIDMALAGVFVEAKLTESDFTQKRADIVERYDTLLNIFHVDALPRVGDEYDNYQIIRNLLAAIQHNRRHILLCDERRPDLVRRYMQTVACLREMPNRKKCRVVFWQELVSVCGTSLREWIEEKYGMCQQSNPPYSEPAARLPSR